MKPILKYSIVTLLAVALVHISCKKNTTSYPVVKVPPIADGGRDQILILPVDSVTLIGKGMDFDGSVVSYSWNYLSGPVAAFTIANAHNVMIKVNNLVKGVYVFELVVTDNDGLTARDEVIIFVGDPLDSCAGCWDY